MLKLLRLKILSSGLFAALILTGLPQRSQALDFSGVPGEALDYYELTYSWGHSAPDEFISDPAIAVLDNGNYLALHSYAGWNPSENTDTKIFISTDKGLSWTYITRLTDIFTASIFQKNNGEIYLFGIKQSGGREIVCKSTDGGTNWSYSAEFATAGHFTPDRPLIYGGYVQTGGNTKTICAPESADWMQESSWTFGGGFPPPNAAWLTGTAVIEEAQAIAIPDKGLFIMTRVNDHPYSPIARVEPSNGWSCFDPAHNYVRLPGGEKKFGAAYDPVSGKAFVVSTPVLPAYPGSEPPNMVRNTGAILSSRDLINWKMEKLYVFSGNWDVDGFGYANFDFDGDDMVIATRTAFPVPGENNPRRGHDSNILGFFKVNDFRNLVPDHYLKIEGNLIKRYERTQYQDAPLGTFELGVSLNSPSQMGQDTHGDVYVQDSGGIKQFDASGNFIGTVASAPVALQAQINVNQPSDGSCAWIHSGSGDWSDPLNWYYWNRPDTDEDIAVFGSAATAPATVTIPSDSREWLFDTAGNTEGWSYANLTNIAVSGGVLSATPVTGDPQISRTDQSFYGSEVSNIVVRMRADTPSAKVGLFWATGKEIGYDGTKYTNALYTGNGEFQDVTLHLAGHAKWDGQIIARLRLDPLDDGKTLPIEIDSITVKKESTQMKGLRFISTQPYTLAGAGALALGADSGTAVIQAESGSHAVQLPVTLGSDTAAQIAQDSGVTFSGDFSLNGHALDVDGSGAFKLKDGDFSLDGGTLTVHSAVTLTNSMAFFDGTVEFPAPAGFAPSAGDEFHILDGSADENTFGSLVLPTLADGLGWDRSALYSNGNIRVILKAPESWMASYGLTTDGSADFTDTDSDGFDNYSEWKAGTNPTNVLSFFSFDSSESGPLASGFQLRWNSLTGRTYRVDISTNLLDNPAFTVLQSNIQGSAGSTGFLDAGATNQNQLFYRVYVE